MSEERGPEGREGQPGREGPSGREGLPGIAGEEGQEGPKGERGKPGPSITSSVKFAFVCLTVIFFFTLFGFMWVVKDIQDLSKSNLELVEQNAELTKENRERISEIQASRVASCRKTYAGILEVFKPFFTPLPVRSREQQENVDKFNRTIDRLQKKCIQQVN